MDQSFLEEIITFKSRVVAGRDTVVAL